MVLLSDNSVPRTALPGPHKHIVFSRTFNMSKLTEEKDPTNLILSS